MFPPYGQMLTLIPFGLEPLDSCLIQYCKFPRLPSYKGLVEKL